ncbi:hypothetical protein IMSAG185_00864 [Lachnospiraceae bacterium]|nr:hypothetical protein IMSAG185_00864 [Lachnospiraceae bacterium]
MLPSSLEISTSLEGMLAMLAIPLASYTVPSTTPPLISSLSAFFANSASTLAGAVASSVEIATALGPSRYWVRPSKAVSLNARVMKVFLYTL